MVGILPNGIVMLQQAILCGKNLAVQNCWLVGFVALFGSLAGMNALQVCNNSLSACITC